MAARSLAKVVGCAAVMYSSHSAASSRRAGTDVDRDVGLGANLVEEVHEFVRAESIRLDDAAPVGIERHAFAGGPMPLRQ